LTINLELVKIQGMIFKKSIDPILAIIPLLFGGLIYICFRDENIMLFHG